MADYDDDHLVERVLTPDEICDELNKDFDTLEITEDETEILMQEALALNKRLKAELKRQSGGGRGIASSLDSSPLAAKPPRQGGKGSRTLLPPIRSDKHGATSSSKRSPGQKGKKAASNRASLSAGSTSSSRNPSTSTKSRPRGTKSADNRPGWNDRFSYSD